MKKIRNPILPGFNPDPSIIRVADDYYIATSTFEWFPGVQIHHSKDLVNWRLIARPLNRISQLDMTGNPDSGGIWAPCLTFHEGLFHLIYTDVKTVFKGIWQDTNNYLVTASDIAGDWSDPVFLNSSGFDPSLFHDDDGRKWLSNMLWESRPGKNGPFGGIVLQEYSPEEKKLVGPIKKIFSGTTLAVTEGSHIYRKGGYYYLLTAEGGTGYGHAVTFARSKAIDGPYEVHPTNPLLTSRDDENNPLQKAGHGDIVETQHGDWYLVHLTGRPLNPRGNCPLGRETAIQKIVWKEDGWPYLEGGGNLPVLTVPAPDLPAHPFQKEPERDDFDLPELNLHFQTLRKPLGENASLTARPGHLRLRGQESLSSLHDQTLVARRQQAFCYTATTLLEFEPESWKQMAGLVCFYNSNLYYYLHVTHDETSGKCLDLIVCDNGSFEHPVAEKVALGAADPVFLRVEVDRDRLKFSYSKKGDDYARIGPILDAGKLSDEHALGHAFTGAFVGICCQDLQSHSKCADFDFFEYVEQKEL